MAIYLNGRLDEQAVLVQATSPVALASTAGQGLYVSMKGFRKLTAIIDILNATTVTGTAITVKQATAVAGTGAKALAFTRMLANIDYAAGQALTETAVLSNTFTTDTTNSKRLRYILEIDAQDLDIAGGFRCVSVQGASAVASIGLISYVLWGARYSGASPYVD
jgi:hypothetical protein